MLNSPQVSHSPKPVSSAIAQLIAHHISISHTKEIITDCPPLTIVIDFKTTSSPTRISS